MRRRDGLEDVSRRGELDDELYAEFGPMRIEPERQPLLRQLLEELNFKEASPPDEAKDGDPIPFPAYESAEPEEPVFKLKEEEAKQKTILDLLMLALRRIFEKTSELKWNPSAQDRFDNMIRPQDVVRLQWKKEMQKWLDALNSEDFAKLRKTGRLGDTPLWNMGLNVLSDVLSHMAVTKIRDWGSFYHLLPENPSAAEWIIFWMRALQTSAQLRGIKGGMSHMVTRLLTRFNEPDLKGNIHVERKMRLVSLKPRPGGRVVLRFDSLGAPAVEAKHVILALPKRSLEGLRDCLEEVDADLDAVFGFPLLKCFFVVKDPWWERNRKPNTYAANVPTRELHYWMRRDRTKGMIMFYTDRPGTQFWADYLPRSVKQEEADRWTRARSNRRLADKFKQYLAENNVREFKSENLLAYGAAAHAWRPGSKSWKSLERLRAFSLTKGGPSNVHVCGEAYSDYQGFIEGALRSTAQVLDTIGVRVLSPSERGSLSSQT